MRILQLTWEYPPNSVGGLARHVAGLSKALAEDGIDVNVVTLGEKETNENWVYRVPPYPLPSLNFINDIQHFNYGLIEKSIQLINQWGKIDIIHAHDWLVAYCARALKHIYKIPLIATIHATEYGRNGGLHNEIQNYISSVEWWLTYEAWKVIVCSNSMKNELRNIFNTPEDKIEVINNGIDLKEININEISPSRKEIYASSNEKIVFFVGRLVPEKGVQFLLQAASEILKKYPKSKFLIAGKGHYEDFLKEMTFSLGIEKNVKFLGFVSDEEKATLFHLADVVVFPSLYEPFGIVALEGMASGTPVIVSDTGGLSEIITHEENGLKCIPGNSESLKDQIIRVFNAPFLGKNLAQKAQKEVEEKYSWKSVAKKTLRLYKDVLKESKESSWLPLWARQNNILQGLGRYEV